MTNKARKDRFWWPDIKNLKQAKDITKGYGGACSVILAFSGVVLLFMLEDIVEYSFCIIYICVLIYFTYRIYKKEKFGSVPLFSIWIIAESLFKIFIIFYKTIGFAGIVMSIFFIVVAINALRGWYWMRKHANQK